LLVHAIKPANSPQASLNFKAYLQTSLTRRGMDCAKPWCLKVSPNMWIVKTTKFFVFTVNVFNTSAALVYPLNIKL